MMIMTGIMTKKNILKFSKRSKYRKFELRARWRFSCLANVFWWNARFQMTESKIDIMHWNDKIAFVCRKKNASKTTANTLASVHQLCCNMEFWLPLYCYYCNRKISFVCNSAIAHVANRFYQFLQLAHRIKLINIASNQNSANIVVRKRVPNR